MLEHKQTTLHRASIVSKRDDYLTNAVECRRMARSSRNELRNPKLRRWAALVAAANAGPSDRPFFWTWFNKNIRHSVLLW